MLFRDRQKLEMSSKTFCARAQCDCAMKNMTEKDMKKRMTEGFCRDFFLFCWGKKKKNH